MINDPFRSSRTAPRQAIMALFAPASRWPDIELALTLDVVATMGAANGFTLAVGCQSANDAALIAPHLPAGVELRQQRTNQGDDIGHEFVRWCVERGFERVIVIAADTIGVSTRLLSTASSILAAEELIVGLTRAGTLYAVGVREDEVRKGDVWTEALAALQCGGNWTLRTTRRLEPINRLHDAESIDELTSMMKPVASTVSRAQSVIDRER